MTPLVVFQNPESSFPLFLQDVSQVVGDFRVRSRHKQDRNHSCSPLKVHIRSLRDFEPLNDSDDLIPEFPTRPSHKLRAAHCLQELYKVIRTSHHHITSDG